MAHGTCITRKYQNHGSPGLWMFMDVYDHCFNHLEKYEFVNGKDYPTYDGT